MSAERAVEIMAIRKLMSEGMKKAEERHGADIASARIWSEWNDRYEGKIQVGPLPSFSDSERYVAESDIGTASSDYGSFCTFITAI